MGWPVQGTFARFGSLVPLWLATALLAFACSPSAAAPPGAKIDYNRDVRPILSENCFACHGPDAKVRKANLRLDRKDDALRDRSGYAAIVPGAVEASELIQRIRSDDPNERMPPSQSRKRLTPAQVETLERWIAQGAAWKEHWAFVAPERPPPPSVRAAAWPRNPIDRFVLARLEAEGMRPAPAADKATLIRRVSLDLTGLPPRLEDVDAFVADPAPDAYERLIDHLLRSPHYGEHLARFWLDAARYGDTHGLHVDNYREIWPYREWVIAAFNRNLPFDQFIIEQLAGDLLENATPAQVVATGFNRAHVTTAEGGVPEELYVRNVNDRVETTGTVFLGMTIGCARCHDHKFDPVTMHDFYQLFAIFNSLDQHPLDSGAATYPPTLRLPSPEQKAQQERLRREITELRQALEREMARHPYDEVVALAQPEYAAHNDLIDNAWLHTLTVFARLLEQLARLEKENHDLEEKIPSSLVAHERKEPRPAFVLARGNYNQRGAAVQRGTPAFLPPLPPGSRTDRLGLARWLVRPDHPLTARVAVNRFWQQIFGTGLVKTVEDFGAQGEPPSHPELLDWLAVEFRENGWDVQKLLKRIVTSATYRQASPASHELWAKDPANRLLARGPRFRLDAEMIRDQALTVSGLLAESVGGPSVKPPQPAGVWEAIANSGSNTLHFVADKGAKVHRRSLYTFWKRSIPPPQMSTFDAPSRESCIVRRERTNTPLQALVLLNETQFIEAARVLAERTLQHSGTTAERLAYLFRRVTARPPDERELAELSRALQNQHADFTHAAAAAQKLIAIGETQPDPTLDPVELAAWTMIGNLLLNLDEVINKG